MGKTYKELKSKINQLRVENDSLVLKVKKAFVENARVKKELQVSNARIVELAQELELLRNGLVFLNEVKEVLNDADFFTEKVGEPILEKMVNSDVAFSSRFMPNVKFKVPTSLYDRVTKLVEDTCVLALYYGFCTDAEGRNIYPLVEASYNIETSTKEVNYLEAIPELVPNGMVYDKESDSLVKKPSDSISSFTKNLAESVPFTYLQIQWVENTFGKHKTKMILDMCSSCGVEVYELQPLKKQ